MSLFDHTSVEGDAYNTGVLSMSSADVSLRENIVLPAVQSVRQEASLAIVTDEVTEVASRIYTSDEIDQGVFGMRWHPVNATWMEGAVTKFDSVHRTLLLSTKTSASGWGTVSREAIKTLPRIGDGKPHAVADFPLAHWKFDFKTGLPLPERT